MTRISDANLPAEMQAALALLSSQGAPIILHHEDHDVGVLVSMQDFELLQRIEDYMDREEVQRSRAETGDNIDWDDLVKELGI